MESPEYFFLIFIVTILVARFLPLFKRISSPKINKIKLHHYMYGVVLVILTFLFHNLTLYGIGLALFIDELLLLIRYGNNFHWQEYDSTYSQFGLIFLVIIIYFLRDFLISLIGF
ncbi:MAG: hypothetical protein Q8O84_01020 [Nanoarchaeota archaeon]|nr:hypothetical protein [Nanoarchaeota archaeon]